MKAVKAISVAFFNMQCETENIIQSFSDVINAICQDLNHWEISSRILMLPICYQCYWTLACNDIVLFQWKMVKEYLHIVQSMK